MTERRLFDTYHKGDTSEAISNSAIEYIEEFRQQKEVSTPVEWLAYIDALNVVFPTPKKRGFYVLDLLPDHKDSTNSLRVLRRVRETLMPHDLSAVLAHRNNGSVRHRVALMPSLDMENPVAIRRATVVDGRLITSPSPQNDTLRSEFDFYLKNYRVVREIVAYHPH